MTCASFIVLAAVRIAQPSPGLAVDDLIVYTHDVTEFGADRQGSKDSTSAIQSALDAAAKEKGGTVYLPAGRYKVDGRLKVSGGVTLRGEWLAPDSGGLGRGTILMAYSGRGEEKPDSGAFLDVSSGACLRDVGIWYPEQKAEAPVPYPAAIRGHGHSTVFNVTLYNAWTGFWNNDCSSMLIRRMYGTPLKLGIHGAYAYDIPRIEHVAFSPKYWSESGLPGAPKGAALAKLKSFLVKNLTCIQGGEQDWGYWWDLDLEYCQKGLFLTAIPDDEGKKVVPGNICAGNVKVRNAGVGVFIENAGYPGFMLTYGDISAKTCPVYFADKPDYSKYEEMGIRPSYQRTSSLLFTGVAFKGGKYSIASAKTGPYGINVADCTFTGYERAALRSATGSITVSKCGFMQKRQPAFELTDKVDQLVLVGNSFSGPSDVRGWEKDDRRIIREDRMAKVIPSISYSFNHVPRRRPQGRGIWDVCDFGAARGTLEAIPSEDSTAAFQKALDAAAREKGGTVYVPAGIYRLEGALKVPTGVELRGSFEGAHYGNSTSAGTQLWVYGGKDRPSGQPLVTLSKGSGFKGFTVFYPEQGWIDSPGAMEAERVKKYPPTVRTAPNCWVQNCTIVCCWTAIDAMTQKSDNIEIVDVTGAAMKTTLEIGHGTTGGVVRDLHFNYSNWTHQGRFPNRPKAVDGKDGLVEYTNREVNGLVLGDVSKVDFFSCFNILVSDQIVLERDRFTGGSFRGKMWGVAFDAAHNGVVGRAGCNAVIGLVASMGVFNQRGGGHYAVTDPEFRGRIVFSNADLWGGSSKISDVNGGSVTFSQLLSWCNLEAVCCKGGELNMLSSTYVGDHVGHNDKRDCIRFEAGSKGMAVGNLDCRKRLKTTFDPSANVTRAANGFFE